MSRITQDIPFSGDGKDCHGHIGYTVSILSHSAWLNHISSDSDPLLMVTVTEWKIVVERWKKGMRPLKIDDQKYGQLVLSMLEQYNGNELAFFDDPVEAVTFIILIGMMKKHDKEKYHVFDP